MTVGTGTGISTRQRPRLALGLLAGAIWAAVPGVRRAAARESIVPAVAIAGVEALAPALEMLNAD